MSSAGGPSSRKSIRSRALLEIFAGLGVLKLESVRDSAFSSSEPFKMSSRSMSLASRWTFRVRLGLSESSKGPGPGAERFWEAGRDPFAESEEYFRVRFWTAPAWI